MRPPPPPLHLVFLIRNPASCLTMYTVAGAEWHTAQRMLFGKQWLVARLLVRAEESRVASILSLAQATELLAAAAAAQAELVVAAAAQEPEPEAGQPEPEAGSAGSVGVDPMPKERVSEQLRAQQLRCELRDCAVCAGLKGKQVSL